VGRLLYGDGGLPFEIDDRTLAHLHVVLTNKLRRAEPFFLHVPAPSGAPGSGGIRSLWIHPSLPLVLHFYGSRPPALNRVWIEQLMSGASGPNGLTLTPEPTGKTSGAVEVDGRGNGVEDSGDPLGL
jgi:hypothetical protein